MLYLLIIHIRLYQVKTLMFYDVQTTNLPLLVKKKRRSRDNSYRSIHLKVAITKNYPRLVGVNFRGSFLFLNLITWQVVLKGHRFES